jgi:nucleotide-binding universal stress UspA family protein
MHIKTFCSEARRLYLLSTKEFCMYQKILLPTDGTKLSKKAMVSAIAMAKLCAAELVVVNVVPRYPMTYFEGSVPLAPTDIRKIEASWAASGQTVVDAVEKAAKAKGVVTKTVVVRGDVVSDAVLSTAKKYKCDLIVMASHGRKGIKRLLLGSETQHILTHSTTPVLVLR